MFADLFTKHDPWQHEWEFTELLLFLQRHHVKTVLEIGTHRGGSSRVFRDALDAHVVTVDQVDMAEGDMAGITRIIGTSQHKETQRQVREATGGHVDFVFIDGGHTYSEASLDWEMYGAFASPNGFVGFHDIGTFPSQQTMGCHVSLVWNEISSKNRTVEWRAEQGTGVVLL